MKCLEEIEREAGPGNIRITMGFVGQVPPNFGIDNMVLFMRGPDDGQLRIAFTEDSKIRLDRFRERLREILPKNVIPWMAKRLEQGGLAAAEAQRQANQCTFGFEPGDIVSSVMSFGSPTPIAVRVVGTDLKQVRLHAQKIAANMRQIPSLRDVGFVQTLDYPSIEVEIDREKAGLSGATVDDVAMALIMGTALTRFASLNYWVDVKTGFDYLVQLQVPPLRLERPEDIETLPLATVNPLVNLMVRDVARVRRGVRPGELDRDMSQRYLLLTANVEGEDMGRASAAVKQALEAVGDPPRGVVVETMGQLPPMNEMFTSLTIGLGVAVFVIFVLLTAYFQSMRLSLIAVGAVPGVLAGIATILYFTRTSLNIESFMGSIMSLGVSVSNSVMLVTFIDEHWKRGTPAVEAAILGASERLRPILMTACAMTVGMVPMALALEKGSQMQAPLGLAVIGGLVLSTFATLLVLPAMFAVVVGKKAARSPSIYPGDRESATLRPARPGPCDPARGRGRCRRADAGPGAALGPAARRGPTRSRSPGDPDGPLAAAGRWSSTSCRTANPLWTCRGPRRRAARGASRGRPHRLASLRPDHSEAGSGIGRRSSLRYVSACSVTSIAWLTSMSWKTWVVRLVGQWISRAATLSASARPICCSSGLAPKLLPEEMWRWTVIGVLPAVITLIRAPIAARLVVRPISLIDSQRFPWPGFWKRML